MRRFDGSGRATGAVLWMRSGLPAARIFTDAPSPQARSAAISRA